MAYYGPAGQGGWYCASGGAPAYLYGRGCVPGAAGVLGTGWPAAQGVMAPPPPPPPPPPTPTPTAATATAESTAKEKEKDELGWEKTQHLWQLLLGLAPPLEIIPREVMRVAEAAAEEVLVRLHPTVEEDQRRIEIINYAKKLIGTSVGCEVFVYGSVPLKTFLPNGDIDITVLTNNKVDLAFIDDVRRLIKTEHSKYTNPRFAVTQMIYVNAQVKLLKCEIDNVTVDVSFNQIGGVASLCFLELVDREIGTDHLFKRSIMLIKTWCYNESKILGAHMWHLSTYALEILILHIFNLFYKSLHGPLEALFKFLEYYTKFDWDRYGVNLDGPISLSSLCNYDAEHAARNGDLLLGMECLRSFDRLLMLPRDSDPRAAKFRRKHVNIIDPLTSGNNLGRSVNRANFFHIRAAFAVGAQKLGNILMQDPQLITDEIYQFFADTLIKYARSEEETEPAAADDGAGSTQAPPEAAAPAEQVSDSEVPYMTDDDEFMEDLAEPMYLTDDELEMLPPVIVDTLPPCPPDDHGARIWRRIAKVDSAEKYYKLVVLVSHGMPSYLSWFNIQPFFYPVSSNGGMNSFHHRVPAAEDLSLGGLSLNHQENGDLGGSSSFPEINPNNYYAGDQTERIELPPFEGSNFLDLTGDLHQHLGCLRHVQYNFQAMFDDLAKSFCDAAAAGVLNEERMNARLLRSAPQWQPSLPSYPSNGDIYQQNVTAPHSGSPSPPYVGDADLYHVSWVYAGEGYPGMHEAVAYMPDPAMMPLMPEYAEAGWMDPGWMDLAGSPSPTSDSEHGHDSWVYVAGDHPMTRGTGTYIPQMGCGFYRNHVPRKYRQKQERARAGSSNHAAGGQTPASQSGSPQHVQRAPRTAVYRPRAPAGGPGTRQTWVSQRSGNGTPPPRHGANASEENHLAAPTAAAATVTAATTAATTTAATTTAAGGQPSAPPASAVNGFKPIQEETIEFGTLGAFSPTLMMPKFIQDFPPLVTTKKPPARVLKPSWPMEASASAAQSPRKPDAAAAAAAAHTKPLEAMAVNPRPGTSATHSRPEEEEEVYQMKDEEFPPLQPRRR